MRGKERKGDAFYSDLGVAAAAEAAGGATFQRMQLTVKVAGFAWELQAAFILWHSPRSHWCGLLSIGVRTVP